MTIRITKGKHRSVSAMREIRTTKEPRIIMSDNVDIEMPVCHSNFLTIMCDTKEEVQRAYETMKEGSKTIYKMEATPYSSCRVVFVDKFGIRWGIMTEQTER